MKKSLGWITTMGSLAALSLASATQAATITVIADVADAEVLSTTTTTTGTSVGSTTSSQLRVGRTATGSRAAAVIPFLLPSLAPFEEYTSAIFSIWKLNDSDRIVNLHLLNRYDASPTVLVSDFFQGSTVPTDASVIQNNFSGVGTSSGVQFDSPDFVTALNALITAGATPGTDYVFIRMAQNQTTDGQRDEFRSANTTTLTQRPLLTLTTEIVPEPASLALLAMGGVLLAVRRSRD